MRNRWTDDLRIQQHRNWKHWGEREVSDWDEKEPLTFQGFCWRPEARSGSRVMILSQVTRSYDIQAEFKSGGCVLRRPDSSAEDVIVRRPGLVRF